ncbi:MAG: TRAP transporter small permease subunit [Spirochaetales bacterium]|nr:MAG: TRAP transporter small permease subunit [Spirochaetales bacterium]
MPKKDKKTMARIGTILLDIIEVYLPTACFALLLLVFIIAIVFRYFIVPLTWPMEFTLMAFIWITLLGACYAMRDSSHVMFSLVYDLVRPRAQAVFRILGNTLVAAAFSISVYPSLRYIRFMNFKKSDVLRIPMDLVFSVYLMFLLIMIGRLIVEIVRDIKKLSSREAEA